MDFKISLKAARVNAELSQAEAAKALGVSVPTLIGWESKKRIPRADHVDRMAQLYGIPAEYFSMFS